MEIFEFGTSPTEILPVQVGTPNYLLRARYEAAVYLDLLRRVHGEPPPGARLKITHSPHDFGEYILGALIFDPLKEDHWEYLKKIELGVSHWDVRAQHLLAAFAVGSLED